MGGRRRNLFILAFVAALVIASVLVIAARPTRLGLDLRGGTELVYQGQPTPQQPEVTSEAIDRSLEIIRERTDKLGVAEPEISRLGTDQISVGLPDVKNAERAIRQVGSTAQMYFYDWEPNVISVDPDSPQPGEVPYTSLFDAVKKASQQKSECENCTTDARFYLFEKKDPHELIAGPERDKKDLSSDQPGGKKPSGSVLIEVPQGTLVIENSREPNPETGQLPPPSWFVIRDRPALSGTDITNPEQGFDPTTNQPNVTFDFTGSGRQKFHDVTREIAQRGLENAIPGRPADAQSGHFAIVLDNEVVSRPIINYQENPDGIDGRTGAQISGNFTITTAQDLADFLRIGALPIELKLISQSTVSATLGDQALEQGLKAGIAGLIIVLIFLILYYRLLGVVASVGLLVYAGFFFALIKLIPITLTLPGIAGLILTIGVAADSNIVIFERIKEEARGGKSLPSAIAAGYKRGIATIIDANVITLLTAFILFVLATAGVKGFAFTLGVGTIVSLFTAVVFTQAILSTFGRSRLLRSPRLMGAGEQRVRWRFDFMGASRWFFSMSGLILAVGAISFAALQLNLGIDFESGTRLRASLEQPTDEEGVRSTLTGLGIGDAEVQRVEDPEFGPEVFQIQTSELEPEQVGTVQDELRSDFGLRGGDDGFQSTSIGPTFGEQVARSAIYAIVFSLLLICGYMALRFEPKYAVPVVIAVFHDVLITAGVYSLSEREVTSATVAAFLTILGYSLYDTVIVFDRIRENVPRMPRAAFSQIVNRSMSEVLTRSLITGLSTVFLITVLLIFGGTTLKDFAFAMMVGVASGTYSSIFIASPVLTAWKEREPAYRRRRSRIDSQMGYVPAFPEDNVVPRVEEERPEKEKKEAPPAGAPAPAQAPPPAPAPQPAAPPEPQAPPDGVAQPPEPREPVETGAARARREKAAEKRRRRQQRRRRKHGRPR
jgi:SecD/SecF fusion protein